MSDERGSHNNSSLQRDQTRIVRIEIVPAEEEDRQQFLLTKVGGKRRQRLLEGLRGWDAEPGPPRGRRFEPERAVEPLLRSLETAHQLVLCMRREQRPAGAQRPDTLRADLRECVLKATELRDTLADYLADIRDRDDPTAA